MCIVGLGIFSDINSPLINPLTALGFDPGIKPPFAYALNSSNENHDPNVIFIFCYIFQILIFISLALSNQSLRKYFPSFYPPAHLYYVK